MDPVVEIYRQLIAGAVLLKAAEEGAYAHLTRRFGRRLGGVRVEYLEPLARPLAHEMGYMTIMDANEALGLDEDWEAALVGASQEA